MNFGIKTKLLVSYHHTKTSQFTRVTVKFNYKDILKKKFCSAYQWYPKKIELRISSDNGIAQVTSSLEQTK